MNAHKRGISQECLKLIACVAMLLDHIGAFLWPSTELRIIGRMAFPIYCFLLVEGAYRTRDEKKYALRLFVGALLAELPFDLMFRGGPTWAYQNVMVTLLLGFCMVETMKRATGGWKAAVVLPFCILAELLRADYGGSGILMIAIFALSRNAPYGKLLQFLGLALVNWSGYRICGLPVQFFAVAGLIPIWLYSGRKLSRSRGAQWAFYLFYPVHMLVIWFVRLIR